MADLKKILKKIRRPLITLTLQNNTDDKLPVSLFAFSNPADISNQTTTFQANITGVTIASPVSITFWPTATPSAYLTRSASLTDLTQQGVINLLNSFGIGAFWLSTSGANTYIRSASDVTTYSQLIIGTETSTITWSNTSTDSGLEVNNNAVLVINNLAPPGSGTVTVQNGGVIDGTTYFGAAGATITITRTLKVSPFTSQTVYTDTFSSLAVAIPSFVIDVAYDYTMTLTTP